MKRHLVRLIPCLFSVVLHAQETPSFRVKYVTADVVYIDAGSAAGLSEDMRLTIKRPATGESPLTATTLAHLVVVSVASTSAACEIVDSEVSIQPGDLAYVDSRDLHLQAAQSADAPAYAQIVEFKDEDPLEEELRESIPGATLREINRFRGRVGFEQDWIVDQSGAGVNSHQQGVTVRFDLTRIGSSYWSLDGYWRGRINSRSAGAQESLSDVLHRVYHFGLRYDSPESRFVVGVGRVLTPWASSLSTLDGGYFGWKANRRTVLGVFGGSTPDPTAWNYDPDRQLGGVFANVQAGSFERIRYTFTTGAAISRLQWRPERQFLFAENGVLVNRRVTLHHNFEVDYQSRAGFASSERVSLSRSFFTLRVQPLSPLSLDVSHNYFRILPTADPRLAAMGLLDNVLFQGLNAGARLNVGEGLTLYGSAGRSERSEDREASWNRTGGLVVRLGGTGLRSDLRYSHYSGTVAAGRYRSLSIRKDSSERWQFQVEAGDQRFDSLLGEQSRARFISGNADLFIGHFVLGLRAMRYRGAGQNYDQFRTGLDYRF
jgi:hypothetical protein